MVRWRAQTLAFLRKVPPPQILSAFMFASRTETSILLVAAAEVRPLNVSRGTSELPRTSLRRGAVAEACATERRTKKIESALEHTALAHPRAV